MIGGLGQRSHQVIGLEIVGIEEAPAGLLAGREMDQVNEKCLDTRLWSRIVAEDVCSTGVMLKRSATQER